MRSKATAESTLASAERDGIDLSLLRERLALDTNRAHHAPPSRSPSGSEPRQETCRPEFRTRWDSK